MNNREFAIQVVKTLRSAGYESLWAGGCVRDHIIGITPKDYDVATNATPKEVRRVFKAAGIPTFAIGEAFGVIMLRAPKGVDNIEVATFRRDVDYSDGRRPDRVVFSTAEEDAERRDFTINGLFFDPIEQKVIDYVGGQADIQRHVVRAIGDPEARFGEDKLRLLRAVRFAATLGFEIEPSTMAAIQAKPTDILIVSGERIGMELRRMLSGKNRAGAVRLLHESGLLAAVLPESRAMLNEQSLEKTLQVLQRLAPPDAAAGFAACVAALLRRSSSLDLKDLSARWKLTNQESKSTGWILENLAAIENANKEPWPQIQRLLIQEDAAATVALARAYVEAKAKASQSDATNADIAAVEFCEAKLGLPTDELNPTPLLTGHDLSAKGLTAGRIFKQILDAVRDAQLNGEIASQEEAWGVVEEVLGT